MVPFADDIDRIMAIMDSAFPPEFGEAWNRRQVTDALLLGHSHHGLITPQGNIAPAAGDEIAGFFLARRILDEEELLLFAIAPQFRRRGLGSRLLSHFIAKARAAGMARIYLEMRQGNPAGELYGTQGFEPVGIRPGYYQNSNGIRINAISQELRLGRQGEGCA